MGLLWFCLGLLISHFKINATALDITHVKPFEEALCKALVYYYLLFCLENMDYVVKHDTLNIRHETIPESK